MDDTPYRLTTAGKIVAHLRIALREIAEEAEGPTIRTPTEVLKSVAAKARAALAKRVDDL